MKTRITICGGGSVGHVTAGFLAADPRNEVTIFTRHPERWNEELEIIDPHATHIHGRLSRITADAHEAVADADVVFLCLPGFAIASVLEAIAPHLSLHSLLGSAVSSTGFFFEAQRIIDARITLFGFQRVPFISRVKEYGQSANLLGYKSSLNVAIEHCEDAKKSQHVTLLEQLFKTPVHLLNNYFEASLTNSNPLLHPSRLYTMWRDWLPGVVYETQPPFYGEWTIEAARLYIAMDNEFRLLLRELNVSDDVLPSVLTYYESHDALSLAAKLRSIEAFKGIMSPMKAVAGGFVPDFDSRYFTEDFPYGTRFIVELGHAHDVPMPIINEVYDWGCDCIENYSSR